MARTGSPFAFALPPRKKGTPAARWLYESLRQSILEGRLDLGARLPTTRELAREYGLARGTVVTAFENLKAEGYVHATVGSGTFVACELPESLLVAPRARGAAPSEAPKRHLSAAARRIQPLFGYAEGRAPAFRLGQPALDRFPTTLWAQIASRRMRMATPRLLLGCDAMGYLPLRKAIAEYLVTARGVRCDAGQVAIVSGTLEALGIVTRLLVDPGERVVIEEPGYTGARLALEAAGARVATVDVDDDGLVIDARRMKKARLVYVTPAHQYPLGVSMSVSRRLALLDWARAEGATIFEDDYDSEYRYCGPPMPSMQGLDQADRVVFSGSFSKVLFPSLRLAYVVLPPDLVEPFAATISVTSRHAPVLDQAVLADFIEGGHFGRHIRRMREVYAERHAALMEGARDLGDLFDLCSIEAGLQTVGALREGIDAEEVAARAAERGIEVKPVDSRRLLLGFAAVEPAETRRGLRVLREVIESVGRAPRRAPRDRQSSPSARPMAGRSGR
jgi:GntR family transcriptional regulator/MocR family aminotransferase